ncbi:tetratricopeptide repeat protein [Burkholderiaceae bacterium]|nr:tetratricopeptide repeat protein [Burkholderiaceae bacterium]
MRKISSRAGGLCTLPTDKPASWLHWNLFKQKIHMARRPNIPNRAQQPKKQVVQLDPKIVQIFQQGLSSHQRGQLLQAKAAYEQVLGKQPKHFDALHMLGVIAFQTKNLTLADELIGKAIEINPNVASAYSNRGNALQALKRLDDALASYGAAIALKPDYADAFNNRGLALQALKRLDDALASYDKAIALKPDYADAFNNRGTVLKKLKRLDDALASYDKAIALKPDYAEAFNNRGNALKDLKRLDDALASYDKAIALKPDYAEAFNNRGTGLRELKRLVDAVASYDKAIALKPDYAEAFNNRGSALQDLKRLDNALSSYDKAIALNPDYEFLQGTKLHTQMGICDWSNLQNQSNRLLSAIEEGFKVTRPFAVLGLTDRPDLQLKASRIYANEKYPEPRGWGEFKTRPEDGKIRIGYYSADFHNHATSFLMAELFEAHDAQKFELYGFSFGPDKQDEMRSRVSSGFKQFFDVTKKSDREVAQMSRELGIDIAVDLKGFTQDARMGIFAEHCAPIQINYLGYPGTLAASYFDYIFADKTLIPLENQQYYSEKIIYLPNSYQVNDSKRKISSRVFTRQELGLPESGFVFCCFNNNYKILPATFDVWMRLLKTVDASVLWLLQDNPTAAKNLRKEAEIRGIDPARLVFAPRMKLEEHLARHRVADLFIDTLPCNAHTTASDELWAELPVLTQMGQSFAARVAASLLNAIDLPELITKTQEEYESRAIELANNPFRLSEIKKKLEQNRETSPLFNGQLFARHIEAAYAEIHRRQLVGEKPDHIYVESLVK